MNIEALVWMAGSWIGTSDDDCIDEQWSMPAGGVMMGMFRWLKNDVLYLYEFLTLEPDADTVVMRIKHFGLGGIGREEKTESATFDLDRLGEREASFVLRGDKFRRLIYRHHDPDSLIVILELDPTGERAMEFRYQRKG